MGNKRKLPFINKRKRKVPVRYVRPYARTKPKMEALYAITQHYNTKVYPKQIQDLRALATKAQEKYSSGGLQWPFDLANDQLETGISRANNENFHGKGGNWHKGYPFNPTPDQRYWIDHNNAVSRDYGAHLKMRNMKKSYDRLDYARKYASNSHF